MGGRDNKGSLRIRYIPIFWWPRAQVTDKRMKNLSKRRLIFWDKKQGVLYLPQNLFHFSQVDNKLWLRVFFVKLWDRGRGPRKKNFDVIVFKPFKWVIYEDGWIEENFTYSSHVTTFKTCNTNTPLWWHFTRFINNGLSII